MLGDDNRLINLRIDDDDLLFGARLQLDAHLVAGADHHHRHRFAFGIGDGGVGAEAGLGQVRERGGEARIRSIAFGRRFLTAGGECENGDGEDGVAHVSVS